MKQLLILIGIFFTVGAMAQSDTINHRPLPALGSLHFAENIMDIQEEHRTDLKVIAQHLKKHPELGILIIGHTDDVGERDDNNIVALKRAKKVQDYLLYKGVNKKQISYGGRGEDNPLLRDTTDYARHINRRVELRYFYKD
ncbi:MAG: OmpA family protein [Bacteroidia bacterium]